MPQCLSAPILALATSSVRDSQAAAAIQALWHINGRSIIVVIVSSLVTGVAVVRLLLRLELSFLQSLSVSYPNGLLMVWLGLSGSIGLEARMVVEARDIGRMRVL